MLNEIRVAVKPNETIAHDDPTALCTRDGWKRYRRWLRMFHRGQITAKHMAREFPPLVYEDNRIGGDP